MSKVICIDGGIGRVVTAIPSVEQLCKQEPATVVVTPWPELFENNPNVPKVIDSRVPGSIWKEINDSKASYIHPEPYHYKPYYDATIHLSEAFRQLLVPEGTPVDVKGCLYPSADESFFAKQAVDRVRAQGARKVVMFQPFGANATVDQQQNVNDPSFRSLGSGQAIHLLNSLPADYKVIYRGSINMQHPKLFDYQLTLRATIALLEHVDFIIGIDSCLLHMAAAMGKPGLVFWGCTDQRNLAYPTFINVQRSGFPKEYVPFRFDHVSQANSEAMHFTQEDLDAGLQQALRVFDPAPAKVSDK